MRRAPVLLLACLALLAPVGASAASVAPSLDGAVDYLISRQQPDGGFAEPGRSSDPSLTAWVVIALAAAGIEPASVTSGGRSAADYLTGKAYPTATDLELRMIAMARLERDVAPLARQLEKLIRRSGAIGPTLNSTMWGMLALGAAGRPIPAASVGYLRSGAHASGGFSWAFRAAPDTNDTAAAVWALRAAGLRSGSRPIVRALSYLARSVNRDGGQPLERGGASDAQSTAWWLQALAATGRPAPSRALAFLGRLQRRDGSFRYSPGRALTPVWVTAQVVPGLAGRGRP